MYKKYMVGMMLGFGVAAVAGALFLAPGRDSGGRSVRGSADPAWAQQERNYTLRDLGSSDNIVSVLVVGSGPAGLMAAVYGARAARDTLVIEGNKPGGLLMDTTEVENWPGELSIHGPQIIEKARKQAKRLGAVFIYDTVESITFDQWPYTIKTENGQTIRALSVIIATGATPKRLGVPGEDANWGMGVSSCAVCDAPFFKDKHVMVVGGGDSAVEEAIQLAPFAKTVTIMVRKDSMRAASTMQERLPNYPIIRVLYNVELKEVVSDDTGVMGAQVFSHETGTTTLMPIDGIFLAIGHQPNTALFQNKLVLDKEGFIKVHERTQKTSMPGVFAAGDVEDKVYRQAGVAAASGIKAALDADAFLAEQGVTPQLLKSHGEQLYCAQARQKRQNIPYLVSQQELDEYTAQVHDSLVVVLFVTQGCSVCTQMIPMVNELASELEGIAFAFVDANKAESLVQAHFVHKVPCVMAFSDNRLLGRYNGGMTKKELTHFIESLAR